MRLLLRSFWSKNRAAVATRFASSFWLSINAFAKPADIHKRRYNRWETDGDTVSRNVSRTSSLYKKKISIIYTVHFHAFLEKWYVALFPTYSHTVFVVCQNGNS